MEKKTEVKVTKYSEYDSVTQSLDPEDAKVGTKKEYVNIMTDDENIVVEKSLLTKHSEYFKVMFTGKFAETVTNTIDAKTFNHKHVKLLVNVLGKIDDTEFKLTEDICRDIVVYVVRWQMDTLYTKIQKMFDTNESVSIMYIKKVYATAKIHANHGKMDPKLEEHLHKMIDRYVSQETHIRFGSGFTYRVEDSMSYDTLFKLFEKDIDFLAYCYKKLSSDYTARLRDIDRLENTLLKTEQSKVKNDRLVYKF